MTYTIHDPSLQVSLLQQCLSGGKKPIGLFLGAGCPMAIRNADDSPLIPDIAGITESVHEQIMNCPGLRDSLDAVENHLKSDGNSSPTVEDLLTHIRALSAVAGTDKVRGLSGAQLDALDTRICDLIHLIVDRELSTQETPFHQVALWANAIPREFPVELFTTNYDLLLEQAFEESRVPYFDGFSGARRPLFDPGNMEAETLPDHWTRVWKLHGSINWYQNDNGEVFRGTTKEIGRRRVIHPSHLKYQESRRMPYLAMVDRLRDFLKAPTAALVLCGYSYRDEHINETIIQGLQHTPTTVAFALLFGEVDKYEKAVALAKSRPNLNVLARDGGVLSGRRVDWSEKESEAVTQPVTGAIAWTPKTPSDSQSRHKAQVRLGDFQVFGQFLRQLVGESLFPWEGEAHAP